MLILFSRHLPENLVIFGFRPMIVDEVSESERELCSSAEVCNILFLFLLRTMDVQEGQDTTVPQAFFFQRDDPRLKGNG